MAAGDNAATRLFWRVHKWLLLRSNGRIGARTLGMPVLLLTTTGRNSGEPRTVALTYLDHGSGPVVIGSNLGRDRHPAWWLNLETNPRATVTIKGTGFPVVARRAEGAERAELWERAVAATDHYAEYEARTERPIPVVVLEPEGS